MSRKKPLMFVAVADSASETWPIADSAKRIGYSNTGGSHRYSWVEVKNIQLRSGSLLVVCGVDDHHERFGSIISSMATSQVPMLVMTDDPDKVPARTGNGKLVCVARKPKPDVLDRAMRRALGEDVEVKDPTKETGHDGGQENDD